MIAIIPAMFALFAALSHDPLGPVGSEAELQPVQTVRLTGDGTSARPELLFIDDPFYLAYLSYRVVERFEPQRQAAYADGRLAVFDREFSPLQDLWLTDPEDALYLRDHTSIALVERRVYVAYAYRSTERGGYSDIFVNVYECYTCWLRIVSPLRKPGSPT